MEYLIPFDKDTGYSNNNFSYSKDETKAHNNGSHILKLMELLLVGPQLKRKLHN
jgi:hypothetical protein